MKKIILIIPIIAVIVVLSFVSPSQTHAAWWNPLSWFSKENQIDEQNQKNGQELQTRSVSEEIAPDPSNAQSEMSEIENLRAEIATLKNNLDTLYIAHNNLVADHNELLKYTNTIAASNKSSGVTTVSSNLDIRVTDLEKKLNDVCAQIFSSIGGLSPNKCPSPRLFMSGTLESRIKKLEGGY